MLDRSYLMCDHSDLLDTMKYRPSHTPERKTPRSGVVAPEEIARRNTAPHPSRMTLTKGAPGNPALTALRGAPSRRGRRNYYLFLTNLALTVLFWSSVIVQGFLPPQPAPIQRLNL